MQQMTMDLAISILGINRTRNCDLAPMAKALSLHSWLNTEEDTQRMLAAKYVLRRWKAYQAECNLRRNRRA